MNVLQILPELHVGGVERGTVDLAKYLIKLGHKVVVVSAGGELVADLAACGAIHYQLPVHKKSLEMIRCIPKLEAIIRKEQIDIVHARSRVPAWIALIACRRTRRVMVTTCHGYYQKHGFSAVMGWGKRVIVPSNVIGRHMVDDFGVAHERVRLICRSVDLEKFTFAPLKERPRKDFNVGIIGRLTPLKGHLDFVRAMARVVRAYPGLKIWIVGDAPASKDAYKEQIRVLVKRLGLWEHTLFLGTQKNIPEVLSQLDVLVLATTTHEAFGRVIVEAQACGVPVVATAVGGVVDIIEHQKTGLLVPAHDPAAMAEAVLAILKDRTSAAAMASLANEKVKKQYGVELMVKNTLAVYEEALAERKILVIKFSSLGDVILSTPSLRAIRAKFSPRARISCLVGAECRDILLRCPYIDELLVCDFKNKDRGLRGLLEIARRLRKGGYDIVIDLQNNRKSHLLSALTLAPDRYGYDNGKFSFLLNHRAKDDRLPCDPVTHQFRVLNQLGIELQDPYLEIWPSNDDCRTAETFLSSQWLSGSERLVGMNIGASKRWSTKIWPLEHMARLCTELSRRQIRVVITGSHDDLAQAQQLAALMPNVKFINACAKLNINQLACLIKKCSVYISGDSAPLHVAAAVGTPFVALFGPTDPRRHLPPAKKFIMLKREVPCGPCYKGQCPKPRCMSGISVDEVLKSVEALLG